MNDVNEPPVRVVLFKRKALPGQQSVERVFRSVEHALPDDIEARTVVAPFTSRGLFRRIGNMIYAAFLRGDVIHIVGDIHYCALLIRPRRCLLTILDLTSAGRMSGLRRQVFTAIWYRMPVRRASRLTAISTATLDHLSSLIPGARKKCEVVPCPVGEEFLTVRRNDVVGTPPVVLQVGTSENKNVDNLITALEGLNVELRLIGPLTPATRVRLRSSSTTYSSAEALSDQQLVQEYLRSTVLVFASTSEGFGLPIVEAQAVGLPVITSDIAPMSEVAGPAAAMLVDPQDPSEIAAAIHSIVQSNTLRTSLIQGGLANVERFRPEAIALQYAHIYRKYRR